MQSSKVVKCTELVSKVSTILGTPNVQEKQSEACIKYFSTELATINMHIKICEYLDNPKIKLCIQDIVKEFENAYMKDLYQQDTDQLFVISSYFTNPVRNQTIEYAIDTINNYMSTVKTTDSNNHLGGFILENPGSYLYRHDVEEQSLSGDSSDIASESHPI